MPHVARNPLHYRMALHHYTHGTSPSSDHSGDRATVRRLATGARPSMLGRRRDGGPGSASPPPARVAARTRGTCWKVNACQALRSSSTTSSHWPSPPRPGISRWATANPGDVSWRSWRVSPSWCWRRCLFWAPPAACPRWEPPLCWPRRQLSCSPCGDGGSGVALGSRARATRRSGRRRSYCWWHMAVCCWPSRTWPALGTPAMTSPTTDRPPHTGSPAAVSRCRRSTSMRITPTTPRRSLPGSCSPRTATPWSGWRAFAGRS